MRWTIDPAAKATLQQQIAASVRRGLAQGELSVGEQLPPAAELAEALAVNRNTVLAAYRELRDDGILEFRRGRGVRVARGTSAPSSILAAAADLIAAAHRAGIDRPELIRIIEEQP